MAGMRLLTLWFAGLVAFPAAALGEEERHHGVAEWFTATFRDYDHGTNRLTNYKSPPLIPIGVSLGARNGHFMFGTEVSMIVHDIGEVVFVGGYIDGLYGADQFCFSLGPELGTYGVGVDGGYMGCAANGPYLNRWVGRVFLSIGVLSAYLRKGTRDYWDAGVLLKFPWGFTLSGVPMR